MRKCLTVSLLSLLLLIQIAGIAFAAEAVSVDIPVVIDGGGTATIIAAVNCPIPTERSIHVDNGRTGHFYITFTETGEYHYRIRAVFLDDGVERESDEVYRLTVTVHEREDGSLDAVCVINGSSTTEKQDQVLFHNEPESTTQNPGGTPGTPENPSTPDTPDNPTTPDTPDTPDTPGTPGNPGTPDTPDSPGSPDSPGLPRVLKAFITPKTGDESHLTRYLLIAMTSSAGLFGLALLYTINTNKLTRKD